MVHTGFPGKQRQREVYERVFLGPIPVKDRGEKGSTTGQMKKLSCDKVLRKSAAGPSRLTKLGLPCSCPEEG